jgi:hypothetical protein
LSEV